MLTKDEMLELDKIQENFEVHNLDTLNWAFKKIASLKEEIASNKDLAQKELDHVSNWLVEVNKPYHNSIEHFETLIKIYHQRVLEQDENKKTLSTPYGKSKARKKSAGIVIKDENVLLQHLEEMGLDKYIKTDKKVKWADLKSNIGEKDGKFYDENGMEIEGIELTEEEINFTSEVVVNEK